MQTKLFYLNLVLLAVTVSLLTACKKEKIGENEVIMLNNTYDPTLIVVKVGTTVTWNNKENIKHSVTSDEGMFESGDMKKGNQYGFTFAAKGYYIYHCSYHRAMKGTVLVK